MGRILQATIGQNENVCIYKSIDFLAKNKGASGLEEPLEKIPKKYPKS